MRGDAGTKHLLSAQLGGFDPLTLLAMSAGIRPTSSEARLAQLLSILEIYVNGD